MAVAQTPPAIVFTDWDGTVTLEDSNDFLTDNLGFGRDQRLAINQKILDGEPFRDGFKEMLDSIHTPFPDCIDYLLKHVRLDPGFSTFYQYCHQHAIPVIVVSSGMTPIIEALLGQLIGPEALATIDIISNDVRINPQDNLWDIVYRHPESGFGHDKSLSIAEWLREKGIPHGPDRPRLFYCGDGVSDLSAAKETDLLFAKHGKDLINYCVRENIPYTEFTNFADILAKMKLIIEEGKLIQDFTENK